MLRFECSCGRSEFEANRHCDHIKCRCGKRYVFSSYEGKWVELWLKPKEFAKEVISQVVFEPPKKFIQDMSESMGQWLKRHGIEKVRHRKNDAGGIVERNYPVATKLYPLEVIGFDSRWEGVIDELEKRGKCVFGKHEHYGKLRGRDAARAAHTYFNRIGFKTRLKFTKNWSATIEKEAA